MAELKRYLSPGYILDQYRIERLIGGGGFSLVYLAYHIPTQARVVIKEYCPDDLCRRLPGGRVVPLEERLPAFHTGIRRFFEEARALAGVNHPNIVRVSNLFRANDTVYMVMDYKEGRDLRWFIKRHRSRMKTDFLRMVFPPLLRGLQAFHDQGLLHLDIKPANILLRRDGTPVLLDFGAVQHFRLDAQSNRSQTLTLGYAPIEQHQRGQMGPWTDIYAMGATLYSCITGHAPPPAPERARQDKMSPANRLFTRHPRRLLRAVDRALSMDFRRRPQSALEFLELCFGEPAGTGGRGLPLGRRGPP